MHCAIGVKELNTLKISLDEPMPRSSLNGVYCDVVGDMFSGLGNLA